MKRTIITIAIVALGGTLCAQNSINAVLAQVEKNNTTLLASRARVDAEKLGNKTGLAPQNPEVAFSYMFGTPSAIGNRTDLSITQSFKFPTAYVAQHAIATVKNEQAELEYTKQQKEVLHAARVVCVKLIYCNALQAEYTAQCANARTLAEAYKAKYTTGDVGVLDYNKAQLNLVTVSKEFERNEIERNALLQELAQLNGGNALSLTDSVFSVQAVPADFEQWYAQAAANNPLLQWVKHQVTISQKNVQLHTANSLPTFSAGFQYEHEVGEAFRGVTVGMTIPLWENANAVKYAKAQTVAMQSAEADATMQYYNSMKALHTKVIALQTAVADYRSRLALYSNNHLLEKAYTAGELSLTEYLYECSLYYQNLLQLHAMEMEYALSYAELNKFQ